MSSFYFIEGLEVVPEVKHHLRLPSVFDEAKELLKLLVYVLSRRTVVAVSSQFEIYSGSQGFLLWGCDAQEILGLDEARGAEGEEVVRAASNSR